MPDSRPEWYRILQDVVKEVEADIRQFGNNDFEVVIEEGIVREIANRVNQDTDRYRWKMPSAPKMAGLVAFWICKLKPFYKYHESKTTFRYINEVVGLRVGLAICQEYTKTDKGQPVRLCMDGRVLSDWIASSRYYYHSLHSSIIAFEIFVNQAKPA